MITSAHFPFSLFLFTSSLLLVGCVSDVAQLADDMRVRTRIGVLADTEIGKGANLAMLEKAFVFYRQQKVDAVVLTGAITQNGNSAQFGTLNQVWAKVFKDSAAKLIVDEGRHEVNGFAFATSAKRPMKACEVLTFYGNRKLPLTDELCFYPRESKAICAGSMHGVNLPEGIKDEALLAKASKTAQGLLVSDYGDRTVICRLDFTQGLPLDEGLAWKVKKEKLVYAEDVADPWEIGAAGLAEEDLSVVPEFPKDASIRVLPGHTKQGEAICTVQWPPVLKRFCGARARWYEVGVAFADQPKQQIRRRTVLSPSFYLSEDRDLQGVTTVFKVSELPCSDAAHQAIIFQVMPIGAFGKPGRMVSSGAVPLQMNVRNVSQAQERTGG